MWKGGRYQAETVEEVRDWGGEVAGVMLGGDLQHPGVSALAMVACGLSQTQKQRV